MLLQHTDCKYIEYAESWNHIIQSWHVFCLYTSMFSVVTQQLNEFHDNVNNTDISI